MPRHVFKAKPESIGPGGAWTYLKIPFNVEKVFGSKARVAVKGTLNGFPFRSSIMPMGDGAHAMMFNKEMQRGAGAGPGDTVRVEMEPDAAPRIVVAPRDFKKALAKSARAKAAFEKLSYSMKKEFVDWIESAKRQETRSARVEKSLSMLAAGKRVKG